MKIVITLCLILSRSAIADILVSMPQHHWPLESGCGWLLVSARFAGPPERHAEFLRGIASDPDDDFRRLIYADWLDENGQVDLAQFIRLQVTAPLTTQNEQRDLFFRHYREWIPARIAGKWTYHFRRGFIEEITIPLKIDWASVPAIWSRVRELFGQIPTLRYVNFEGVHDFLWTLPPTTMEIWNAHRTRLTTLFREQFPRELHLEPGWNLTIETTVQIDEFQPRRVPFSLIRYRNGDLLIQPEVSHLIFGIYDGQGNRVRIFFTQRFSTILFSGELPENYTIRFLGG